MASGHPAREHASDRVWLAASWPFVRGQLPPPARVIELGCASLGGHVPALLRTGYEATGADPEAPEGPAYVRATFEEYRPEVPADAVVASVSLIGPGACATPGTSGRRLGPGFPRLREDPGP